MARNALMVGLAALLLTDCSQRAPQTNQPIAPTKLTTPEEYDALQQTIAELEGHTLIREVTGTYEGHNVRALVYQSKWNAAEEIHAIELVNPTTKERIYAATPLGKQAPFNRAESSSKSSAYSSEDLARIYTQILQKD